MACAVRALLESVEFTRCFSVLNWLSLVKILILFPGHEDPSNALSHGPGGLEAVG